MLGAVQASRRHCSDESIVGESRSLYEKVNANLYWGVSEMRVLLSRAGGFTAESSTCQDGWLLPELQILGNA